jgi:hypothetical protein
MPTIKITDQLGVTIDAKLAPTSTWLKYARDVGGMLLGGATVPQIQILKLNDPAVRSLTPGLTFQQPVTLGNDGSQLTIGADAGAALRVLGQIFPHDDFGEDLRLPAGNCYVSLSFHANVNAGAQQLGFGITAGTGMGVESCRPFPAGDDGPTVVEALQVSIGEFVIPASSEDLEALPAGTIVTVSGSGRLKFSGTANLLALTNPLATATLPSPLPALSVNQAASVTVGASWKISTEYQVRTHKVAEGRARLAWYRKRESDFEVSASASAGITAGTDTTDLFPMLIRAISPDATADLASMPADQAAECRQAVADAVNRNLQVSLEAELGALRSDEAMFLYEVDFAALDAPAKAAVAAALAGDLTGLAAAAGVTEVRSIHTRLNESRFTFKVNLLGIFNYGSVSRLALESKVTYAPSTGDLVIVDKASATRIQSAVSNFGPDEEKLRALMAESFLITAAYRGSKVVTAPPELTSSHMFFRLYSNAGRDDMRNAAAVAAALRLQRPEIPASVDDFGRTSVLAETSYDDALSHALFLHPDGKPRTHEEYEASGRKAVQLLVLPDGDDRFRLAPATDDALWERMKDLGPANFEQLFAPLPAAVIRADYLAIEWWADTMCRTGAVLARIAAEPQLRDQLAKDLRDVAGKAHEQFGKPWGLVAMFLAGGGAAPAGLRIAGKRIAFAAGPALAAGAPAH